MIANLRYFTGQTYTALRRSAWISVITTATICVALLVPAIYVMTLQNLESLTLVWGRAANIVLVLSDEATQENQDAIVLTLQNKPEISRITPVTPQQAIARFRARGPKAAALVDGVSEDILPTTIELLLETGFARLERIETLATQLQTLEHVSEVDYGQEEFEQLQSLITGLRYGGLGVGLLLFLAASLIVANTIRLNVYAHRDEISILKLVGATNWFIRLPFLLEGAFWGITGGVMASLLLWLLDLFALPEMARILADAVAGMNLVLFTPVTAIALLLAGLILGTFGSALAVRRFLEQGA